MAKAKTTRRRHVTIMLVPHWGEHTYQVRVPVSLFHRLLAVAVVCVAVLLGFGQAYSRMLGNMDELRLLREESLQQRLRLDSLADRAAELQEREARVAALEREVRELIENDQFLPEHVKTSLLRNLGPDGKHAAGGQAGGQPRTSSVGPTGSEGAQGEGGAADASGLPPWRRSGQLASRAGGRPWSVVVAGLSAGDPLTAQEQQGEAPDAPADRTELEPALDGAVGSGAAAADRLEALRTVLERRREALLSLPQCMPTQGRLTSGFGYRRSPFSRAREFHSGVDLAAPRGTPVRAVADGVVSFAGWKPGLGQTVIVKHGQGVETLYGHNSRLTVQVGARVETGEVIALVGDTGRSTGDHLHFELHFLGREVDPWPYLLRLGG